MKQFLDPALGGQGSALNALYQGTTLVVPTIVLLLSSRADFSPRGICFLFEAESSFKALGMDYEIAPEDLKSLLEANSDIVVLDCREPWEFGTAKIAGSHHIPMNEIPARFQQELDVDKHIIVVCHHGVRSMNVTMWLRRQGLENVQSLSGGIDLWARLIDPTVPLY